MDLNLPHYRVGVEQSSYYLSELKEVSTSLEDCNVSFYLKDHDEYRTDFLTVINTIVKYSSM
eukprot:12970993-Ditylum_brightwellii.AAC.1